MKLIKKITFKRVKQIAEYKKLLSIFEKIKKDENTYNKNSIKKTKDTSKLNYFIIIEYENILKKKFDINDFIDSQKGPNHIIDLNKIISEKEEIEKKMMDKKNKGPACFLKLGLNNDVKGCYIVATNKKSINQGKELDTKNNLNQIVVKLGIKNLPKEIDELCNEFYNRTQENLKKEKEELDKFSKLNKEEQDNYIYNILENINSNPSFIYIDNINYLNFNSSGFTFFDGFSEKNLENINDVEFLEALRINAEEKEKFEFCAKIRDRIKEIKSDKNSI